MAALQSFLASLRDEIQDVDEETSSLFSSCPSLADLGMPSAQSNILDLTVANRDFAIKQSPGLLQSKLAGGTTGAAVWQTSLRIAEWIADERCSLFEHGVLTRESAVLELGSGVSGMVPVLLSERVGRVLATDQPYALKLLKENVDCNKAKGGKRLGAKKVQRLDADATSNVDVKPLDWEADDEPSLLRSCGLSTGVDAIIACDCIYNTAMIRPFTQACTEACQTRSLIEEAGALTVCIVAQHLRQADVFEEWLKAFKGPFRVWRVPNEMLSAGLKDGSGFAVHVGVLR